MRKTMFLLAIFASTALTMSLSAQEDNKSERKIALWGHVKDNVTRVGIDSVMITLMTADSTVVDSMHVFGMGQWDGGNKYDVAYRFQVPARPQTYIIRATHPDYETQDINFEIKRVARNTYFDAPHHLMKRRPTQEEMYRMLETVEVKATKVKMVFKGDTIIYNADAFNLPEGSMLDALIRQLDGVELKDNGQILVNGQQIDELTLNGKDFFKHDKRVLLDNLPSYTVSNVQVYHKSTERSQWLGRDVDPKLYVMDVQLKREYAQGWLFNMEMAGGTVFDDRDVMGDHYDDRFLARFFGLRYTDNSRLTTFANTNNVNETRQPGSNGEWSPSNQPQGQRNSFSAGVNLLIDEKDKKWKENATAELKWEKFDDVSLTSSEQFFAASPSTYSRSFNTTTSHDLRFGIRNQFQLKKPFWWENNIRFGYYDTDSRGSNRYANMLTNPSHFATAIALMDSIFATSLNPDLQAMLVNRNRQRNRSDGYGHEVQMTNSFTKKLATGDEVGLDVEAYTDKSSQYSYAIQRVDYYRTGQPSTSRNRYTRNPSNSSWFEIHPNYSITWLNGWSLKANYTYRQSYTHQTRDEFRLDQLPSWEDDSYHPFGTLPSARDSLLLAMDANNSYERKRWNRTHTISLTPAYSKNDSKRYTYLMFDLPVNMLNNKLHYMSAVTDTTVRDRRVTFTPYIYGRFAWDNWMKEISFNYQMEMMTPDLYNKVNVRNDADPLNIRLGNPHLKMQTTHRTQVSWYQRWNEHNTSFNIGYGLRIFLNQVSQGYSYNTQTGIYTFMPQNVDGNWQTYFWSHFSRTLDKDNRLSLANYIHGDYSRNVDYAMATNVLTSDMPEVSTSLSHVNNWYLEDRITLNYRFNDWYIGTQLYGEYRHANNKEHTVETIDAIDFSYGINASYAFKKDHFPKWLQGLNVSSDIKMFSRRGYGNSALNTDDLVWNASVSQSFCRGRLVAKINAFDILHQLTNTQVIINGQGRTETIRNTLPRYVMLHLTYKFQKLPKRRKGAK